MFGLLEKEPKLTDWTKEKNVLTLREDLERNGEAIAQVREQLAVCRQVCGEGGPRLDELRADQLLNGHTKSDRFETLAHTIADAERRIASLERDERVLLKNHEKLSGSLKDAIEKAKNLARERIHSASLAKQEQLKELVLQAKAINDELLRLEAEIATYDLGEGGSKRFILFARHGAAWNALSAPPIKSKVVIHSDTWLAHVNQLLGA